MLTKYILSCFSDEYSPSFDEQLAFLCANRITHTELRFIDGKNIVDLTDEEIALVKEKLLSHGISVSAIGSPIGKISLDGDLAAHREKADRVFQTAGILGTSLVRIFSFYPAKGEDRPDRAVVLRELSALLDLADRRGVTLCHENEAGIYGNSPDACLDLLTVFGGRLKAVFDMGNFVIGGYDPAEAYRLLSPYIAYFHIKDARTDGAIVPAGEGDAKIASILAAHTSSSPVFLSLEPHLQTFVGLSSLTKCDYPHPFVYKDAKESFSDGLRRFLKIFNEVNIQMRNTETFVKDSLTVKIYPSRAAMGAAAAEDIVAVVHKLAETKSEINMIFAAAPSQNEVLSSLLASDLPWEKINAFHMDEYIGLSPDAPQGFGNFLRQRLFDKVPFRSVNCIDPSAKDASAEAARYAALLSAFPADLVVMGIGENGHIAFNDPPVADFHDPLAVKMVALDSVCRQQQVNDGCFASLDEVPRHALTLTVPTLFAAPRIFCIVPGKTKAVAVRETLCGTVDEHCPASILRRHVSAKLYLDADSASLLDL
jgi:glucosamine-6-phosphate deaminase